MSVHFHNVKRCIRIVFPTAAEVQDIIDAPDLPGAGDTQPQRIVFPIAGIRKIYLPEHRRIESTGGTQAVNAQGIVPTVTGVQLPWSMMPGGISFILKSVIR